jgi:hypothetical protein
LCFGEGRRELLIFGERNGDWGMSLELELENQLESIGKERGGCVFYLYIL